MSTPRPRSTSSRGKANTQQMGEEALRDYFYFGDKGATGANFAKQIKELRYRIEIETTSAEDWKAEIDQFEALQHTHIVEYYNANHPDEYVYEMQSLLLEWQAKHTDTRMIAWLRDTMNFVLKLHRYHLSIMDSTREQQYDLLRRQMLEQKIEDLEKRQAVHKMAYPDMKAAKK